METEQRDAIRAWRLFSDQASTPGPKYCTECGAPNDALASYCAGCGKRFQH